MLFFFGAAFGCGDTDKTGGADIGEEEADIDTDTDTA